MPKFSAICYTFPTAFRFSNIRNACANTNSGHSYAKANEANWPQTQLYNQKTDLGRQVNEYVQCGCIDAFWIRDICGDDHGLSASVQHGRS